MSVHPCCCRCVEPSSSTELHSLQVNPVLRGLLLRGPQIGCLPFLARAMRRAYLAGPPVELSVSITGPVHQSTSIHTAQSPLYAVFIQKVLSCQGHRDGKRDRLVRGEEGLVVKSNEEPDGRGGERTEQSLCWSAAGDGEWRSEGTGKAADEPRIHSVGFAKRHPSELPVGISEPLMTIRLVLANNHMSTVEVKETFCACLDETLSRIPREVKIILLGDFNARDQPGPAPLEGRGREGIKNINPNGVLLLSKCAQYDLSITNTLFRQKHKFRASWRHLCSKQWHLIDFVIVRARDRRDVNITATSM
ncbi:hypothetical protein N1851_017367 [Merluccius polli]|uniref:Endonuclease/exonuclease/phosphatase domain-containing protein n=1 Tax=Merluccius polli TaxID=89951 RepID=A0AA47MQF5_MERPO|nr:hypothetical protein N1851_017367 [Merluccius polli]